MSNDVSVIELSKKLDKIEQETKDQEEQIKEFSDTLKDHLENGENNKKYKLYLQIYKNACYDRQVASILFTKAFASLGPDQTDHVMLGPVLVKYIERMTKSNEQILEISKLLVDKQEKPTLVSKEDIFNRIQG